MSTESITIDPTDLDSLAEAVAVGVTTVEQLANWIGVDLIDGCLVLDESPMFADDGNSEQEYPHDTESRDAAAEYVSDGDWGQDNSTSWVTVYTYRKAVNSRGEIERVSQEDHTIALHPEEPACEGGEHVWHAPHSLLGGLKENPGVWGKGGGIISKEICRCCGCVKETDTWAQNPSTGEHGLTVSYTEGEYADEMEKRAIARAKQHLDTGADAQDDYDFCWTDEDGCLVGCYDDDLRDYGYELARNADAPKITGTEVSAVNADE
jgi:hypothetical protein